MSSFIKKLFGALVEKPWEENQAKIDDQFKQILVKYLLENSYCTII